jgi:hypothetical protein
LIQVESSETFRTLGHDHRRGAERLSCRSRGGFWWCCGYRRDLGAGRGLRK